MRDGDSLTVHQSSGRVRPRGDTVVVRLRDATREEHASGLVVVRGGKAMLPVWADVVDVGPGRQRSRAYVPTTVRAGERVLVAHPLVGQQIWIDGAEHRMIREDEIELVAE